MNIEPRYIITSILVVFKVYVILNFILKFRRMKKRVKELELEVETLKQNSSNQLNKIA
jgi:hypothetical protein